jgi:hypothetical protein
VPRYVLTYRPAPVPPEAELALVGRHEGVRVLDRAGRSVYIESSEAAAARLASALPDWTVASEKLVPLPDTQPRVHKKPGD